MGTQSGCLTWRPTSSSATLVWRRFRPLCVQSSKALDLYFVPCSDSWAIDPSRCFLLPLLVGGSCCDTTFYKTTGFRGAVLVFGSALGTLSRWSHITILRLSHPVNWGACLARLRSLLKIGLFCASFDFASVKLVVSSVYSALPQFNGLLCASNSELHFRQSQKGRERELVVGAYLAWTFLRAW